MKTGEKHVGTKAQIRAIKKRERRIATAIFLVFVLLAIALSGYFTYSIFHSSSEENALPTPTLQFKPAIPNPELKAVIVDHLSLTAPNETFTQTAATILTKANYTVDYYSGEKVTVNFYRNLPTGGYKLIILRVHSALDANGQPPLTLFTSEFLDSRRHVNEQLTDQLQGVVFLPYKPGDKAYFGIPPKFIRQSIKGELSNSLIIAMGCDGLTYTDMAEAFIEKGAKAYISWNGSVSASHTDQTTTCLLKHLITQKETIKQSVENTMKEVGPDPASESVLGYYPLEAG
jgi:flagellar basal body-associated protein FliL